MPPLEWNRKWGRMLAELEGSAQEPHWGDRWGGPGEVMCHSIVVLEK